MKLLFMAILCLIGTPVHADEVKDLYQCKIEKVLLVDKEEVEWLGKEVGTPYHCANPSKKGILFWNWGKEDLAVLIDPKDPRFTWYKDEH